MESPLSPAADPFMSLSAAHPVCGGSAGKLVSGSRAGQNSSVYAKGRQEKSAEPAACSRAPGKGSWAAFKQLKEVTVLPGALFLPALTAGKTSE